MKLHYNIEGEGAPLVILHGLFGSSDNWRTTAKQLAHDRQVITVDLRNHGQSSHSDSVSYPLMAGDIAELITDLNLNKADVIGHSIGGKVAMTLAEQHAEKVSRLIVVDIAPKQYADQHSDIFDALLTLDLTQMTKRSEADNALSVKVSNKAIRQFLLMNLALENGKLKWRLNLPVLAAKYPELIKSVCESSIIKHRSLFLRGAMSNYIDNNDIAVIEQKFPNVTISTIEQAGHWIHAEKPDLFIATVQQFLYDD